MPYIGRAATNTGNVRYLDDIASGFDGSDTTFTAQVGGVSITPDQESVKIFLDGVFQHPGSGNAYTISGSTITFTAAPVANTVFSAYVVGAGAYLDDNAVSSAKLDDDAVTAAKLDDDGTGFQVGDLGVGGSLTSGDKLTVTGRLRASGGIVGDLTGNVTGNVSGTAAAGTLTGNTLASTVTASSLTSVGTIGTGVWQGTAVASAYLDADTAHLSTTQTFSGAKTFGDNLTIANNKQILGAADGVAYSFTGDTDTGIQSGGTNTIQITTAGSKAMDFDGNQLATFTGNIQTTKGIRAGTYSANNAFSENGIDNLQVHYARFGGHSNAVADILYNAYWTGSAWINDNDSNNSYLLRLLNGSGLTFQVSDAGATPSFATKFSVTNTGDAIFAGGIQSKGTDGNNPTGDWYDVKQKFLTYKHEVTGTHVNDGYFSVSHGINRGNILGVIPHHYGYAGTNKNNFGITSGFVEKVIMYANATLRVYIGSSVVASDKIYLTMIVEGNTG